MTTMDPKVELPDELATEIARIKTLGEALRIRPSDDEATYSYATTYIAEHIHPGIQRIAKWFKPLKQSAHESHKRLTQAETAALAPYEQLKDQVAREAAAWRREQQRKHDAQLRAERDESDRLAEAQRADDAAVLAEAGQVEAAEELLAAPLVPVPVVSAVPAPLKVSGVVPQRRYKARIDDMATFLKWIGVDPATRGQYVESQRLTDSHPALDALARAQRTGFVVPGCAVVEEDSTTYRTPTGAR